MKATLVALVGGSGSGKSWLSENLEKTLHRQVTRISLDDFYRDQSHLSPEKRARLNFDHPRLIDWDLVETVLTACREGRPVSMPSYCFVTHTRKPNVKKVRPQGVILVDGLWLLRRPGVRRLFDLRVFIHCSEKLRLSRRLARDIANRGRDLASVRRQFRTTVAPMHKKFVDPQARWADVIFRQPVGSKHVAQVARLIEKFTTPAVNPP